MSMHHWKPRTRSLHFGRRRRVTEVPEGWGRGCLLFIFLLCCVAALYSWQTWQEIAPSFKVGAMSTRGAAVVEESVRGAHWNHPASDSRPVHQFLSSKVMDHHTLPLVVLCSLVRSERDVRLLATTLKTLQQQSLPNWRWHIISSSKLRNMPTFSDDRIRLSVAQNTSEVHNEALMHMRRSRAVVGVFLAAGSMLELTVLEKTSWAFSGVQQWSMVGFWVVEGLDRSSNLRKAGLNIGLTNSDSSHVPASTFFRMQDVGPCNVDSSLSEDRALRHFWSCFAERGKWGGTIPEIGLWIPNQTPVPSTESRPTPVFNALPRDPIPTSAGLEKLPPGPLVVSSLRMVGARNVLILQDGMTPDAAGQLQFSVVRALSERGHRVTVVNTRYNGRDGVAWRAKSWQFTHDIHFLPTFLQLHNFIAYVASLIETRGITSLYISGSEIGYAMLPSIAEKFPRLRIAALIDPTACEQMGSPGVPSHVLQNMRHLHRVIVTGAHCAGVLERGGYPAGRIGIIYPGVNVSAYRPFEPYRRTAVRQVQLGASERTFVILLEPGALVDQFVLGTMAKIRSSLLATLMGAPASRRDYDDILVVAVGKPDMGDLRITPPGIALLPHQEHLENYVQVADILLTWGAGPQPRLKGVAAAMSCGLPVVALGGPAPSVGLYGDLVSHMDPLAFSNKLVPELCRVVGGLMLHAHLYNTASQNALQYATQHLGANHVPRALLDQHASLLAATDIHPRFGPNPASAWGLLFISLDDRITSDVAVVQNRLLEDKYAGRAGELQTKCSDASRDLNQWITSIVAAVGCDGTLEKDLLFKSGREQCGGWCIWDLSRSSQSAWVYNGQCFRYYEQAGLTCQMFWYLRPKMMLPSV